MVTADTSPHLTGKTGVSRAEAPRVLSAHVRALGLQLGGLFGFATGHVPDLST